MSDHFEILYCLTLGALSDARGTIKKLTKENRQLRQQRKMADLRWFSVDWERRFWKERCASLKAKITRNRKRRRSRQDRSTAK